ncbi:MAG: formylglycine-generating enzyme family protein, partial [Simkaniaceae bacterium]|nr:formylglycine-generating enzyme family protein [Simkaniaceae bacterium]
APAKDYEKENVQFSSAPAEELAGRDQSRFDSNFGIPSRETLEKSNPESTSTATCTVKPKEPREMIEKVSQLIQESQRKPILNPQEVVRPTYDPDPSSVFHIDSTVAPYRPKEKEIKNIEPIMSDMVIINGGEFHRGSDEGGRDERPRHIIRIQTYAMDTHPITNEQFVCFLEVMGGEKDSNNQDILKLRESRIKKQNGKFVIEAGYSKHPVIGITWYGAVAYAKWVGKRLPTEAEWEIAARGGIPEATYTTGNTIDRAQSNFFSADTTPVKSYPANGYGLYDIAGNVYEWCQDWYDYNYYDTSKQEPDNPKGPIQGVYRVLRGGCWKSLKEDLRCSHRHRNNPGIVNRTYGFRCAADVEE